MDKPTRPVLRELLSCAAIVFLCSSTLADTAGIADKKLKEHLYEALRAHDPGSAKPQEPGAPGAPDARTSRAFSLVNSGGVSLGVYEAGLNWALLRLLRDLRDDPDVTNQLDLELYAAAGASAGAINGFLAGLFWCSEAEFAARDTLESNLFRDSWLRIDVNELINHSVEKSLPEDNAAFSRVLVREIQSALEQEMDNRKFQPGCQVAFGLSLTRSTPVLASNAGVDIVQQRLVLPLIMTGTQKRKIEIENFRMPLPDFSDPNPSELANRPFRSSIIYLDGGKGEILTTSLPSDAVFAAIKASSSFPVAFASMRLSYCIFAPESLRQSEEAMRGGDRRCPPQYRRLSSYFVDGGVFDNDPVELVRQLSKQRQQRSSGKANALYVKIDPGRRRPPTGLFRFVVPPYGQAGDSLEVSLWAGARNSGDHRTVKVRHCPAAAGEPHEHNVALTETSSNSHLYIGTVHTRKGAADDEDPSSEFIRVKPLDRLLVYDPEESDFLPQCSQETDGAEQPAGKVAAHLQAKTRKRTINILEVLPPGLSTQLAFVGGSVASARGYRLYDELMSNNWHDGVYEGPKPGSMPLFQPARLTPLVGDFLFSFAAFIDERFRKFDYYAGVYDAVYGVAEFLCVSDNGRGGDRNECRAKFAEKAYLHLCAPGAVGEKAVQHCREHSQEANAVLYQMVVLEVCGTDAAAGTPYDGHCDLGPWNWAANLSPSSDGSGWNGESQELLLIGATLQESNVAVEDTDRDSFVHFVKSLASSRESLNGDDAEEPGEDGNDKEQERLLDRMLARSGRPVSTWYYPVSRNVIPQLLRLEDQDKSIRDGIGAEPTEARGIIKPVLALGGLFSESVMRDPNGWLPDQTSVPEDADRRWLATLSPSEIAVDPRNGGWGVYWRPGFRTKGAWGVDFRISPYVRQGSGTGQSLELAEATAFVTRRLENPLVSSIGAGPTITHIWNSEFARDDRLGASVAVGILADKLRVTYGIRSFESDDFAGDDIYWHIGVNDLPGIFYWACRGVDRAPAAISWACGIH